MPKPLIVHFTPIKSCLVNLPPKWVNALLDQNKLPQNVILEIASSPSASSSSNTTNQQTKKIYCGWSGEASKPSNPNSVFTQGANSKLDILEMDPQLGLSSGFVDGQKILVEFCRNVPECSMVSVEPLTEDDWEILELHAGYVEENLLSQLRVVYPNQIVCVWIHGKTLVKLVVAAEGMDPPKVEYAKLTNMSEVIVAPKVRNKKNSVDESNDLAAVVEKKKQKQPSAALRVCPLKQDNPLTVVVHPDSMHTLGVENGMVVKLSKLVPAYNTNPNTKKGGGGGEENNSEQIVTHREEDQIAKSVFATLHLSKDIPLGHVVIGSILSRTLEIKDFDIVKVSVTNVKKNPAGGSIILKRFVSPNSNNTNSTIKLGLESAQQQAQQKVQFENETTKAIQEWLSEQQKSKQDVVLSQGIVIELTVEEKQQQFLLLLGAKKGLFSSSANNADPEQYTILSFGDKLPSIEFSDPIPRSFTPPSSEPSKPLDPMGGVDKVLSKITNYTLANLSERDLKSSLGVPGSGGVLVSGSHGSGKTSLVHTLLSHLHSHNIYTLEINCSELADERIPVFKESLQKWFDQAAWHAPSLVFFDDLDRLIPAEVEHADGTRSRHLAELFVKMAQQVKRHNIMLMATTQQQQSLHPALITYHIFSELNHLQPPNRDERILIMQAIMSHGPSVLKNSLPHIDLVAVASETEGFLAADLKSFIERTVHEGAVRSIKKKLDLIQNITASQHSSTEAEEEEEEEEKETLTLVQTDFTKAREGFVPSSLRGVKLQSSGVAWSDIGGLNETRKALLETLEWPTKYAAVFAQCPLRLRSGLLLYGYPGCGKTLLASAVAKECGLNFISVKGPEILNKYIGASEKSVRDLFERAQAAKPCVLFFDEFDSIAPRRGHDSTGVTDRVVNQMLTQMDGAEGLDGVYVLAATSRPDLIDPALLRPGRLDKALLCGLPNLQERLEILQALSDSKMKLANDVNLIEYAEKTEGFSGADLQGFLYNAHLEAIHGAIDMDSFKQAQNIKSSSSSKNEKSDFVMSSGGAGTKNKKVPLTLAEKSQISSRLAMIKKGVKPSSTQKNQNDAKNETTTVQQSNNEATITKAYLDKSLKSTRPSITVEESYRLGMIYNEFVTGRTGELPSGEGDKGVGKRSTLG